MNDIQAVKKLGASEIFFIMLPERGIKDLLAAMERFRRFRSVCQSQMRISATTEKNIAI